MTEKIESMLDDPAVEKRGPYVSIEKVLAALKVLPIDTVKTRQWRDRGDNTSKVLVTENPSGEGIIITPDERKVTTLLYVPDNATGVSYVRNEEGDGYILFSLCNHRYAVSLGDNHKTDD